MRSSVFCQSLSALGSGNRTSPRVQYKFIINYFWMRSWTFARLRMETVLAYFFVEIRTLLCYHLCNSDGLPIFHNHIHFNILVGVLMGQKTATGFFPSDSDETPIDRLAIARHLLERPSFCPSLQNISSPEYPTDRAVFFGCSQVDI